MRIVWRTFYTMKDMLVPVSMENDLGEMMKKSSPVPLRKKSNPSG